MTTWTPATQQPETWTENPPDTLGAGFSLGFAARPAFAIAIRAGIWTQRDEQSEVWTPA